MADLVVGRDDPLAADVQLLLEKHLAFAKGVTPAEDVHALDVAGLLVEDISLFSIRRDGVLLAVGALKQLDSLHAEIKSMHVAAAARGQGVGRAMIDHLVGTARARGYSRVSLETGPMAAFSPARALYASAGFTYCEPFADYGPRSVCMTLELLP